MDVGRGAVHAGMRKGKPALERGRVFLRGIHRLEHDFSNDYCVIKKRITFQLILTLPGGILIKMRQHARENIGVKFGEYAPVKLPPKWFGNKMSFEG